MCWVLLPTLLLPASTLLTLMDLLGSVRRDGLSALASLPLCRLSSAASMPRELLQGFSFGAGKARLSVPLVHCRPLHAPGVSRGCFHCDELHAYVAWHLGACLPCHDRRFQLLWPRAVAPRLACTCDDPPLHAGSKLHIFCLVVRSPFHVPWLPPLASLVSRGTLSLAQTVWPQLVVALIRVWTFTASLWHADVFYTSVPL